MLYCLQDCNFYNLRKQQTYRDVTTGFPRNDVRGTSAKTPHRWRVTTQIRVVPLIGCAARGICFNQSEALPKSGQWHVTSMELPRSPLKSHLAGKPIVASRNVSHFLRVQLLLMLFSETKIFLHRSIYHTEFGETATPQKNAHSRKCESLKLQILL